jgi:hypothetical protein
MKSCSNHKYGIILRSQSLISVLSLVLIALIFFTGCNGCQNTAPEETVAQKSTGIPKIEFIKQYIDIGTVTEGERTGVDLIYVNKGKADLLVLSCQTSCGCTVPSFSREPLSPGDTASVRLIFDSSGTRGVQNKSAHVVSNAVNAETDLLISAFVIENMN